MKMPAVWHTAHAHGSTAAARFARILRASGRQKKQQFASRRGYDEAWPAVVAIVARSDHPVAQNPNAPARRAPAARGAHESAVPLANTLASSPRPADPAH